MLSSKWHRIIFLGVVASAMLMVLFLPQALAQTPPPDQDTEEQEDIPTDDIPAEEIPEDWLPIGAVVPEAEGTDHDGLPHVPPPSGLRVISWTSSSVTLQWNALPPATSYRVE